MHPKIERDMHIYTYTYTYTYTHTYIQVGKYGVATISRLLKIIGLFCKIPLERRLCSAKETYNLKEPPKHSHPRCG